MKKNIYIMRHGQTLFNKQGRVQGFCDSPLTRLGIEQAKIAGKWFKNNGIKFNKAYTSTSERAMDTLELVAPYTPYKKLKDLREWNFGEIEGQDVKQFKFKFPYDNYLVQFGGESDNEFHKRTLKIINDIVEEDQEKNVLILTHGMILRIFAQYNLKNSKVESIKGIKNCCIFKYEYDTDTKNFTLIDFIKHDFSKLENNE